MKTKSFITKILKFILSITFVLCVFGCSNSEEIEKDIVKETVKEKIEKSYTEFVYDKDGNLIQTEYGEFDKRGNLIKYKPKYSENEYENEYNARGNQTKKYINGEVSETWEYNTKGNVTKHYLNGKLETDYEYDTNGNLIWYGEYKGELNPVDSYFYSYDTEGHVISEEFYYLGGDYNYSYIHNYEYDKNGHLIREDNVSPDDKILSYTLFYYDEKYRISTKEVFRSDVKSLTTCYKYDAKGNLILYENYNEVYKFVSERQEWKYDTKGKVLSDEYCVINIDGRFITFQKYEYEYNAKGNLLSKKSYYGDFETQTISLSNTIENEWDLDGYLITQTRTDAYGNIQTSKFSYTFY